MKKNLALMISGAMFSLSLLAQSTTPPPPPPASGPQQQAKTPEERAERRTVHLAKELGLTQDQQVKVKAVILKHEQVRGMQAGPEKREEIAAIDAELKNILTAEQFQKLQQMRAANRAKRDARRQQTPPPAPAK